MFRLSQPLDPFRRLAPQWSQRVQNVSHVPFMVTTAAVEILRDVVPLCELERRTLPAGEMVLANGPMVVKLGQWWCPLTGGGFAPRASLRFSTASDFQVNPDLVVITLKADKKAPTPQPRTRRFVDRLSFSVPHADSHRRSKARRTRVRRDPNMRKAIRKKKLVQTHLSWVAFFWFCEACASFAPEGQCFIDALRGIGINAPYSKEEGYWAQKDGDQILSHVGKRLVPVPAPCSGDVGKYVVHAKGVFVGLRLHVDECVLCARSSQIDIGSVEKLNRMDGLRFFKVCSSSDWAGWGELGCVCRACTGVIHGVPVEQGGEGAFHFGCVDLSRQWTACYPHDAFGNADDAHTFWEGLMVGCSYGHCSEESNSGEAQCEFEDANYNDLEFSGSLRRGGGVEGECSGEQCAPSSSSRSGKKDAIAEDLQVATLNVYPLAANDVQGGGAVVPSTHSGVLVHEGDSLPPHHRELLGEKYNPYISLETTGDGACGLHAVFGRPREGRFHCSGARGLAASYLEKRIDEIRNGAEEGVHYEKVRETWWSEFCVPCAAEISHLGRSDSSTGRASRVDCGSAEPGPEAQCFWEALEPDDKKSVCETVSSIANRDHLGKEERLDFDRLARCCFHPSLEKGFFKHLAVFSKMLPDPSINYLEMTEYERKQCIENHPGQCELLGEPFFSKPNGDLIVRGTLDVLFPLYDPNPPRHKYAALFDPRPCFDAIRSHFLRPAAELAVSRGQYMLTLLDDLDCTPGKDALAKCRALADRVTYQRTVSSPPADFMRFAPQAYLKALQSENYYFSCEELLWLAECAHSNVIIARFRGCSLLVEGSELGGQGPVAVILLQGDGRRSHFERLCPQAWVPEVEKAMYLGSMGYAAQMTTDFAESNCLIEAILCALHSQGF